VWLKSGRRRKFFRDLTRRQAVGLGIFVFFHIAFSVLRKIKENGKKIEK
jgi:hypothetical protein